MHFTIHEFLRTSNKQSNNGTFHLRNLSAIFWIQALAYSIIATTLNLFRFCKCMLKFLQVISRWNKTLHFNTCDDYVSTACSGFLSLIKTNFALTWTDFIVCMISELNLRDSFFAFWTRNETALWFALFKEMLTLTADFYNLNMTTLDFDSYKNC